MGLAFLCPSCGVVRASRGRCERCAVKRTYSPEQNARHNARPRRAGYYTTEYRKAREVALRRDGGCVVCGAAHGVQVHHIDHDTTNNVLDNLVSMCARCHQEQHRR